MTKSALDGVKVVEFATMVSGPYCGKLPADMGADVFIDNHPPEVLENLGLGWECVSSRLLSFHGSGWRRISRCAG